MDANKIKVIKKAVSEKPGNDLEIENQTDGSSVAIKEANEYVRGRFKDNTNNNILIKAIEFTSKSDEDLVEIVDVKTSKKTKVQKKLIEPTELFEYGVYNSETDIYNNPKSGENIPNELNAAANMILDRLSETVSSIEEVILFIKDNTKLSHETLDNCVTEIKQYIKSLNDEKELSMKNIIN